MMENTPKPVGANCVRPCAKFTQNICLTQTNYMPAGARLPPAKKGL